MGLIVDTNVFIEAERNRRPVSSVIESLRSLHGDVEIGLSAISIVELTHGIYRAKTEEQRQNRQIYTEEILRSLHIHSISTEIAQLAGRIEGQQAAKGSVIPFQDLLIGSTALHIGSAVLTRNVRHFQLIPGLEVHTLPAA